MTTKQRSSFAKRLRSSLRFSRKPDSTYAGQPQQTFRVRTPPLNVPRPPGFDLAGGPNGSPRQSAQEDRPALTVVNCDVSRATSSQSLAPPRPNSSRSGSSLQDWLRSPDAVGSSDFIPVLGDTPGDIPTTPAPLYPRSGNSTPASQNTSPRPARLEDIGTAWHNRSGGWSAADLFGDWRLWKDVDGSAVYQPAVPETSKPDAEQVTTAERSNEPDPQSAQPLKLHDGGPNVLGRPSGLSDSRTASISEGEMLAQEWEKTLRSADQPFSPERTSNPGTGAASAVEARNDDLGIRLEASSARKQYDRANGPNSSGGLLTLHVASDQSAHRTARRSSDVRTMQKCLESSARSETSLPASVNRHGLYALLQADEMRANNLPKGQRARSDDRSVLSEAEGLRELSKRRWRVFRDTSGAQTLPANVVAKSESAGGEDSRVVGSGASTNASLQNPTVETVEPRTTPEVGVAALQTISNASQQRWRLLHDEAHARLVQLETPVTHSNAGACESEGSVPQTTNEIENDILNSRFHSLDAIAHAVAGAGASYPMTEQTIATPEKNRRGEGGDSPVQLQASTSSPARDDASTTQKSRWTFWDYF